MIEEYGVARVLNSCSVEELGNFLMQIAGESGSFKADLLDYFLEVPQHLLYNYKVAKNRMQAVMYLGCIRPINLLQFEFLEAFECFFKQRRVFSVAGSDIIQAGVMMKLKASQSAQQSQHLIRYLENIRQNDILKMSNQSSVKIPHYLKNNKFMAYAVMNKENTLGKDFIFQRLNQLNNSCYNTIFESFMRGWCYLTLQEYNPYFEIKNPCCDIVFRVYNDNFYVI